MKTAHSSPSPLETGLDGKVALFGYGCLCLNVLFFSYLWVDDPWWTLDVSTVEDGWVENLTAVWFLLAGLLLFAAALMEPVFFRRCLYILGSMALVFISGEEISWGQRMFGFATPDFLKSLSLQDEFNVHNLHYIHENGMRKETALLLLCMVIGSCFLCRKDSIFGIPLPSILLVLGLLVALSTSYRRGFLFAREKELLFVAIYALFSRQGRLFMITMATAVIIAAMPYDGGRIGEELQEYLCGIVILFYSLELLLAQGRLSAISWVRPFTDLKRPAGRSFRLMICSLVIGCGSIGLMFFKWDAARVRTGALMEAYRSVQSAEPVISSTFDVYLMRNRLIYLKEPCDPADTGLRFFLHVIPADANDLPQLRKLHGFENYDFRFGYGDMNASVGERKCLAIRPLPDYKIAKIETGQFTQVKGKPWGGTFTLNK